MTQTWANPNDTASAPPENVVNLMQKLHALAERGGTNHEAAAAAAMLHKHLTKWNVTLTQLEGFKRGPVDIARHTLTPNTPWLNRWKATLWHTIARANFCDVILSGDNVTVLLIGHKHNQFIVEQMYSYLEKNIKQAWKDHAKKFGLNTPPFTPYEVTRMRVSFAVGFTRTVADRLDNSPDTTQNDENALAILNDEVTSFIEQRFGKLKSLGQGKLDHSAYHAGKTAGKNVNLDAQVTRNGNETKALAQG